MLGRIVVVLALLLVSLPAAAVTVEKVTSAKGIEAWLVQDHSNPIIAMEIAFKGGAAHDPAAKSGLAGMMAALLDEGAGPYDSQAFQQILEDKVITLGFNAGRDSFAGHLKTLSENKDAAFDLFRLSLSQPRFDKEPVERIRGQLLAGLMRESQDPGAQASRRLFETAFAGHAYARSPRGAVETVKTIQVADLRALARAQLTRDRLVVAVVGDMTPDELARRLDEVFGALPATGTLGEISDVAAHAPAGLSLIPKDNPQTTALFVLPGLRRDDPQWYAAYVVNYILGGGGFASRLTEEVREKRGLAYSVTSYLSPLAHSGMIIGSVATEASRFGESVRLIRQEFRRMHDEGPTEKELADAKTYLNGSFPLSQDSTTAIAALLVQMQVDKLGIDFLDRRAAMIEKVSMDDARHAAKRLLDADALSFVAVGRPVP
ncbi:Zinc Protease [Paramagnetospirillum magnetotacticum MS-1]|uniref:Zinc Protease n=1 Tax=Paramagnetospirillum magnetotacticum MS-1 TaxID=272627 RepID=A0A0C2UW97_PARME|nr:pitrilysin family protein [Paramagnetospirillum magnetotacticum]KIL97081.1 Zinc Protease [Paramagnetospirillum magnetotacticum MS-1]